MRSLFLSPQSGNGPSISSSVVQCSVFLLVCISVPVLAVYFCPSSVRVVATFLPFEDFTSSVCCPLDGLPARRRVSLVVGRDEFRPRQTRQLPSAVDMKGRLLSCQSY